MSKVVPGKEGIGYNEKAEECPEYNKRDGDCVIDGRGMVSKGSLFSHNNASVVIGRDRGRTGTVLSGYGGVGEARAGAIDICVGRMSPMPKTKSPNSKSKNSGYINDPIFTWSHGSRENIRMNEKVVSYFNDAARIWISQKTDCDYNFRLAEGRTNPSPGKEENPSSAIVMQADDLRFVSRRGIKIVTLGSKGYGETPVYNSMGSRITKTYGIDLIAGNGVDANGNEIEQEPLVKGKLLAHCLQELSLRIEELQNSFFRFQKTQIKFNGLLMNHTHGETFAGAITLWSPAAQGGALSATFDGVKQATSTVHGAMNLINWRNKWLGPEISLSATGETNLEAGNKAAFNSKYNSTN